MADGPPSLRGPMPSSFDHDQDYYNERPLHKVMRKIKEEPLIPLGIGLTTLAFINAYRALRKGDSKQANRMFRARVAAQGFTVIAMVAGSMYYQKDREKSKELRQLKEQRDAEEKRLRWIRELEARDEEDKAMRARLQERRAKLVEAARTEKEQEQQQQPEQEDQPAEAAPAPTTSEGTGGILAKMGLWPQGEKKADAEAPAEETVSEKAERKKNPKSSLGDLGEIMAAKKKEEAGSKKE